MRPTTRSEQWMWQEILDVTKRGKKTLNGHQSIYFNRLMDLAQPVEANDAATKKYVDDLLAGSETLIGVPGHLPVIAPDGSGIVDSGASTTDFEVAGVMVNHLATFDHTLIGVDLGSTAVTGHLLAYDHTLIGAGISPGSWDVMIYIESTSVKAVSSDGTEIDSGTLGTDDTDIFDSAIAACPNDGKLFIGPGLYTLLANKLFYLDGPIGTLTNPFYYAIGILEGKNIHISGAGQGITTLKMAAAQHSATHYAIMILNRSTGNAAVGSTAFTVEHMTLDGNKAAQTISYKDGSSLILTGSTASNFKLDNVELKNSWGYGVYYGNNGLGPCSRLRISHVYAHGCVDSSIITDTSSDVVISDCLIFDSNTGLELYGNTDYLSRKKDKIVVNNVNCVGCGITVWCINDVLLTGCHTNITGAAPAQHGFLIHSSIGVYAIGCTFECDQVQQHATYIDANTYLADGETLVHLESCNITGYHALKVMGNAVAHVNGGTITSKKACIYLRDLDNPIYAKLYIKNALLVPTDFTVDEFDYITPNTYLLDIAAGGTVIMDQCEAQLLGAMLLNGFFWARGCTGAGLNGYNSMWRLEEGTYEATPASTSTITMLANRTTAISVGTPVKYLIEGVVGYGIVTALTANLMTIAGAPLGGSITALFFGTPEMVGQIDYAFPGVFCAVAGTTLIETLQKSCSVWRGKPAYLVQISHKLLLVDSGTAPKVTASVGGSVVGTDNTNTGLAAGTSLVSTIIGINTTNYRIEHGDAIEIRTTAGGSGDAEDLTVLLTFVAE